MNELEKLEEKLAQLKKGRQELVDLNKAKHEDEKEDKKQIEEKLDEHNEKKHGEAKDEDSAIEKGDSDKYNIDRAMEAHDEASSNLGNPSSENSVDASKRKAKFGGPKKEIKTEEIKFKKNGQWSISKADDEDEKDEDEE